MKIAKVDFKSPTAPKEFVESIRSTGFAIITNHDIDEARLAVAYGDWIRFFLRSDKMKFKYGEDHEGYFPFKSENAKDSPAKDLKEFYHLYKVDKMPIKSPSTSIIRADLMAMADTLLLWVQIESPREVSAKFLEPLPRMIQNSDQTLFRILHYPPLEGEYEEGAVRAAAHEDINLLTLLPAATEPGLEVLGLDGQWYAVETDPGNIIVNVGDMLQLASGGYYKSTTHRVVNPKGPEAQKSRYSMPLFLHPRPEVRLSQDRTAGEYLTERLKELGLIK